jgi:hypothetical protein
MFCLAWLCISLCGAQHLEPAVVVHIKMSSFCGIFCFPGVHTVVLARYESESEKKVRVQDPDSAIK